LSDTDDIRESNDSLDGRHQDFDWEGLYELLGETQRELSLIDYDMQAIALKRILAWVLAGNTNSMVGRRAKALAWVLNPAMFQGSPSMSALARSMDVHKACFSELTSEASRVFGITNRAQSHGAGAVRVRGIKRKAVVVKAEVKAQEMN
jgi:hypothetical protein